MEVKPGYKRTEVGVIPEEWEVVPFGAIVQCYFDYRGRTPRKLGLSWGGGEILALSANNVEMGRINLSKESYVAGAELYRRWMTRGDCERGDILLTTEAPAGNVAQIPDSRKYILSQRVLLIRPKACVRRDFLAKYMSGPCFQAQLEANSTGSTAKGIQRARLDRLSIAFPHSHAEQATVARALSDVDGFIEFLEPLLAKKRLVKQGAMQELLTGKRRLPGFTDRWEFAPLSALADIRNGGTPSTTQPGFWNGDIPWCTPSDITALKGRKYLSATGRQITGDGLAASAADILPSGSIVMTSRATIGECAINAVPMTTNQGFKNFVPASGVDAEFLYYRLVAERPRFIALSGGSTFLEIGKSELTRVEVEIPPTTPEQRAIAAVLSDTDAEIEALEAKLAKASQIKQGMMQELLTGRIRLV